MAVVSLERVSLNGFRCIQHADVELKPLTVLIGKNDTGKSAFLDAIFKLCRGESPDVADCWRKKERGATPELEGFVGGEKVKISRIQGSVGPQNVIKALRRVQIFRLPSAGLPLHSPGVADRGGDPPVLTPNGDNLPAFLDYVLRTDRDRFDRYQDAARQRIEGLESVQIRTPSPDHRRVDLMVDNGLVVSPGETSAGVRLLLFFLALTYHPNPPNIILLEEPENGLHPKRLGEVVDLLRDISRGQHCGHPAQVIVSTHSPYLLDFINIEEDQVLVFRRKKDGTRTVEPVKADRLKAFLVEFKLGEVWFNKGEDGLVGK